MLDSFQAALSVLAQTGKVPEPEHFSSDSRDNASLAQLRFEGDVFPYTSSAVSPELRVVKIDEPVFERAMSWIAFIAAAYASMRIDDLQEVIPKSMTLTDAGFRVVLGRAKGTMRCQYASTAIPRLQGSHGWKRVSSLGSFGKPLGP